MNIGGRNFSQYFRDSRSYSRVGLIGCFQSKYYFYSTIAIMVNSLSEVCSVDRSFATKNHSELIFQVSLI